MEDKMVKMVAYASHEGVLIDDIIKFSQGRPVYIRRSTEDELAKEGGIAAEAPFYITVSFEEVEEPFEDIAELFDEDDEIIADEAPDLDDLVDTIDDGPAPEELIEIEKGESDG